MYKRQDSGSGKADGKPCANKTECKSGYCVDDVCCESDCAGLCSTCKASGKEGLCTSYAANTDPDGDCTGAGTPTDPCAGTCDGKSACTYPSGSKSCAAQVCSSSVQSNFACSGAGACVKADKSCGNYQCSGPGCLTQCSADAECISTTYCKAPTCDLKLDLGKACPKPSACKSGICFGGTCCNATCGANFECSSGSCKCNGQTCDAGQGCVLWYQDSDNDGFGNAAKSILGCANKKPAGYVADKTDCYDANADAKPGQTQWFPNHRGDGKFDYNCDNTAEQYYKTVSGACQYCSKVLDKDPPCNSASYDCWCDIFSCTLGSNSGLSADGPCGTIVTLKTCTQDTAVEVIPGGGGKTVCVASAHANSSQTAQLCR